MKHSFIPLFVGLLCWTGAHAAIRYVSPSGNDANDGLSVATAKATLTAALNSATSDDEIRVQAGTYEGTYTMKDGVNVSGGWNSTFDVQNGATILDANNSGRVVDQSTPFSTLTVWSNLIIRNGSSNTGAAGAYLGTNGQLDHCIIENNVTTNTKACGGVQIHNGGKVTNCIIRNNTSSENAGGVRMTRPEEGNPSTLANCLIYGNSAAQTIGGVSLEGGEHYVYNNTIVNNSQTSSSNASRCGVRLNVGASLKFANNIVWGNKVGNEIQASQMEINNTYLSNQTNAFRNNAIVYSADFGTETIRLTADPFEDEANGNYLPTTESGLVDSGDNDKTEGTVDLVGNDRIFGEKVDIGAYEGRYVRVKSGDNLQYRISCATTLAGNEVRVQAGTFTGNFTMREGVNVSGGWNSTFDAQTDYATILDANNSGRVVTQSAAFSTLTIWSNLTIQNGAADTGAGVLLNMKGQIKHCTISSNAATGDGGGVYNDAVVANTDVLIDDCIIRENTSEGVAGGVRIRGTIQNSTIQGNQSASGKAAGGAQLHGGRMINCKVIGNTAGGDTGGVRLFGKCLLVNSLIANNTAEGKVGGVGIENANSDVINCTIVGNNQKSETQPARCGLSCGAEAADNGTKLANNIIWGNMYNGAVQNAQIFYVSRYNAENRIYNAAMKQTTSSTGCISLTADDPGFVDAANGDYRLTWQSELIDKGSNTYAQGELDLANNGRIQGTVDMGCYEKGISHTRSIAVGQKWGTICMPFDITNDAIDGATMYKVLSFATNEKKGLLLEQVDDMEAGKPYFFQVNEEATTLRLGYVCAGDEADPGNENGLYGTIAAGTVIEGADFYVLQGTELHPVTGGAIEIPANRAYLKFSEVPEYTPMAPSPRRRVLGIHSAPNSATGFDEVQGDKVQSTKVIRNGQLFILRDGKMYNALGQQL